LALVIAPLYVPVLVLGVGAVELAASGVPAAGAYLWLGALLVLAVTLAPLAVEAALRINIETG
jgi:heme exporter protein B